jgi:phosphoserine phosphatase RsbX
MREAGRTALVEWAAAWRSLPGEDECGDLHLVASLPDFDTLAVIDGLGHGPEAAKAAACVRDAMAGNVKESLSEIVRRAHEAARGTRGAVASLARVGAVDDAVTWLGVGNVTALIVPGAPGRARESMGSRGGVVGYRIPPLSPRTLKLGKGDTIVLATDGLGPGYAADAVLRGPPEEAAHFLVERYAKPEDDALVLVARYWGREG